MQSIGVRTQPFIPGTAREYILILSPDEMKELQMWASLAKVHLIIPDGAQDMFDKIDSIDVDGEVA